MTTSVPIIEMMQRIANSTITTWWERVGVSFTWATVMTVTPLRIRPTGQADTVTSTPETLVSELYVGDRVLAVRFGSSWVVLGRSGAARGALPVGTIISYAAATAPNEVWALADGSSFDPVAFPALYARIGTTYGGTAAAPLLPDTRNRVAVGLGSNPLFDAVGKTGGATEHVLTAAQMPTHTHAQNPHTHADSGHTHGPGTLSGTYATRTDDDTGTAVRGTLDYQYSGYNQAGPVTITSGATASGAAQLAATAATNQDAGGGEAHPNVQPYVVVTQLIKMA